MDKTPETIYLIPGEDIDGELGYLWCDDPAPSNDHDPAEAVEYVRVDSGAHLSVDCRVRQRNLAMKQRDEMEVKLSKARQIITDLVEYAEQNDPGCPHLAKAKGFLSGGEHD